MLIGFMYVGIVMLFVVMLGLDFNGLYCVLV